MRYFEGTYETWKRKHKQISFVAKYLYLLRLQGKRRNFLKFFWLLPIYCNVWWQLQLEQAISLLGFPKVFHLFAPENFWTLMLSGGRGKWSFVSGKFNFEITLIDVLGCTKCDTNLWWLECEPSRERWKFRLSYSPLYGRTRVLKTDEVKNVQLVCKFLVLRGSLFKRRPFRSTYNRKGFQFNFLEN